MRDIITLLEENSKPQDIEIIPLNFTPAEECDQYQVG
jgi:hypothetical protein